MISLKDANIDMSKIMDDIRKAEKDLSNTLHFAMEDELIKEDCIKLGCPIRMDCQE